MRPRRSSGATSTRVISFECPLGRASAADAKTSASPSAFRVAVWALGKLLAIAAIPALKLLIVRPSQAGWWSVSLLRCRGGDGKALPVRRSKARNDGSRGAAFEGWPLPCAVKSGSVRSRIAHRIASERYLLRVVSQPISVLGGQGNALEASKRGWAAMPPRVLKASRGELMPACRAKAGEQGRVPRYAAAAHAEAGGGAIIKRLTPAPAQRARGP